MKTLARVVINFAAFIGLSGDDVIDPDSAVKALEEIGSYLADCSNEERAALQESLQEERLKRAAAGRSEEELAFFDDFMDSFDLSHE